MDVAGNSVTSTLDVAVAASPPFYLVAIEPDENRGEAGLTIHLMVQFSRAVNPPTLTAHSFFATAPDGTVLPATIVVGQDGVRAWLFFDDPLPGASRITLNVEGSLIRAANDGAYLDANANATPGGSLDAVTLNGDVVITDNASQTIRGGLTLNADLLVDGVNDMNAMAADVQAFLAETVIDGRRKR